MVWPKSVGPRVYLLKGELVLAVPSGSDSAAEPVPAGFDMAEAIGELEAGRVGCSDDGAGQGGQDVAASRCDQAGPSVARSRQGDRSGPAAPDHV
jgi:hypothetical protein